MGLKTYLKERLAQYIESKVWQRFFDLNIRLEQQNKLIEQLAAENCQQREQLVNLSLEFEKKYKGIQDNIRILRQNYLLCADLQDRENIYDVIDYFDFENHFRGSTEIIKKKQQIYVPYFLGKRNVLDIGCGRGEFLSLLKENNIEAQGIDLYSEFVEICHEQGLAAVLGDGIEYLKSKEKWGGIFAGQVVEHLQLSQIITLCKEAYVRLEEGAYLILETPNPTTLCTFACAFYMDPSHYKPLHPATLQYFLEKAGFREIEIVYNQESRYQYQIPSFSHSMEDIENLHDLDYAVQVLNGFLFGSMDYAVIAKKS